MSEDLVPNVTGSY